MRGEETYLEKTLHLENELTGKMDTLRINLLYLPDIRHVNISRAIS